MKVEGERLLLRIFVSEAESWHGKPLYQAILEEARTRNLAGATVLRAMMGFGCHHRIHTTRVVRLSEDLPVVVEIVDERERIEEFLTVLDERMKEGLVTVERVKAITYRREGDESPG